jgi:arsenate reductase
MAEGWLRHLAGDRFEVVSAGTHPVGLNPYAVTVMGEAGVDISNHVSERVDPYLQQRFDYVITVCDRAQETCPTFPGESQMLHWSFEDPAKAEGTYDRQLVVFRKIRDQIADRIRQFISESRASGLWGASGREA